jgi:transcriptional regulator with XRE-family HTH domain
LRAFGQAVRHERERNGISQDVFAEIAHVHRTYVGSVERGERNLTLKNIAAFSKHSDFLRRSCSRRLKSSSTSDETGYFADVSTA